MKAPMTPMEYITDESSGSSTFSHYQYFLPLSAHIIQLKINQTSATSNGCIESGLASPTRTTQQPLSQTWCTPSRMVQRKVYISTLQSSANENRFRNYN